MGTALRVVPLPLAVGGWVGAGYVRGCWRWVAASSPGVPAYPGRAVWPWLQTSYVQDVSRPLSSTVASTSAVMADPNGDQDSSSRRFHLTCPGRPRPA